jgi:hypothetical protein
LKLDKWPKWVLTITGIKSGDKYWQRFGPIFTDQREAIEALCLARKEMPNLQIMLVVDDGTRTDELSLEDEILLIAERELK